MRKVKGHFFAACVTTAGLAGIASAQEELPRGRDIGTLAGNCAIGPFEQTAKAGPYNELCAEMSDAEKCLALFKGQFDYRGGHHQFPEWEEEKARYCLDVLRTDLGLEITEGE